VKLPDGSVVTLTRYETARTLRRRRTV